VEPFRCGHDSYWGDTDGGIVYYGTTCVPRKSPDRMVAVTGDFSQLKLAEEAGGSFAVVSLNSRVPTPAKLDDELATTCDRRAAVGHIRFCAADFRGAEHTKAEFFGGGECTRRLYRPRPCGPKRLPDFLTKLEEPSDW